MEPDSIMLTVMKGWYGDSVFRFLSTQKIIEELSWGNDRKVFPSKDIQYTSD